jgi:hypothetical protein
MKKLLYGVTLTLALSTTSYAKDAAYIDTRDESSRTAQGLYPVHNAAMEMVHAKPGASLAEYDQFMLDEVVIAYKKTRSNRASGSLTRTRSKLDDEETAEMMSVFNEIFANSLGGDDGYKIVEHAGDTTLRITPYILDLVVNVPLDTTAGRSSVYVDSVADMTLMLEFRDSVSGELLVQAAERRAARSGGSQMRLASPAHNRREVERLLKRWARLLRDRFDALHTIKVETK